MTYALVAFAALIALPLVLLVRRLHVRAEAQGHVDENGQWSIAGGASAGPLAVSFGAMNGRHTWAVHLFGRKIASPRPRPRARARSLLRRLRLADASRLALDLAALARFDALEAHVRCGAHDPALTGPLAGTLAAVSGALAPFATITHEIEWLADDAHVALRARTELSIVPARALAPLARFALQAMRRAPAPALAPAAST